MTIPLLSVNADVDAHSHSRSSVREIPHSTEKEEQRRRTDLLPRQRLAIFLIVFSDTDHSFALE